ncbi:unnamed protein product, partial [Scytosiphon promiscuus]
MTAKTGFTSSLQDQAHDLATTVDKAKGAVVTCEQRLAEVGRSHKADLDAGAAREAELQEKITNLDSNVRQLEGKLEVANAASDDARVEVLELTYKLYRLEKDAAAERERRDTAELALREELAHLREAADAGAAREVELEE